MRLIDADKIYPDVMTKREALAISQGQLAYAPTVEAIPKADYENRLKADMVAMLTEIQLEIEEMVNPFGTRISGCSQDGWKHGVKNCDFVIQQKINKLKGNEK